MTDKPNRGGPEYQKRFGSLAQTAEGRPSLSDREARRAVELFIGQRYAGPNPRSSKYYDGLERLLLHWSDPEGENIND